LHISLTTVLSALKKKEVGLASVNTTCLRIRTPDDMAVTIERDGEAERDEMWSDAALSRGSRPVVVVDS
jgi:hypothetical protein